MKLFAQITKDISILMDSEWSAFWWSIWFEDQIFVFVLPYSFEYVFQRKYDSYQPEHEKWIECWPFSHIKKPCIL